MDEKRALSLLGLAMRAGQVISGTDMVVRAVRSRRVTLVLLDVDASDRTRDEFTSLSRGREIPLYILSAGALGSAIGKEGRIVAAVRPGPLAEKLKTLLNGAANP